MFYTSLVNNFTMNSENINLLNTEGALSASYALYAFQEKAGMVA